MLTNGQILMCYMSIFLFDVGSAHGHGPNGLGLDLCPDLEHGLSLGHGPGHGPGRDLGFGFVLVWSFWVVLV